MLSSKNMIILTVALIKRRYFTREGNKQHIHHLKLKRGIFVLPRQGEIPGDAHSCLFQGCASPALTPPRVPRRRSLVGGAAPPRGGGQGEVQPGRAVTQLRNTAFLQHAAAQDTLSCISDATVVCKFKSSVMTGEFRYNVN